MDPEACWREIAELYATNAEHWDRLEELADGLYAWLRRDGFPPEITGNRELDKLIALRVCESIAAWEVA